MTERKESTFRLGEAMFVNGVTPLAISSQPSCCLIARNGGMHLPLGGPRADGLSRPSSQHRSGPADEAPPAEVGLSHTRHGPRAGTQSHSRHLFVRKPRTARFASGGERLPGLGFRTKLWGEGRSRGSASPGYYRVRREPWSWEPRPPHRDARTDKPAQNSGCQGGALGHSHSSQYLASASHALQFI